MDLLKKGKKGKKGFYKLAIMEVFLTAAAYLSNIKTLRFNVLFIMVKHCKMCNISNCGWSVSGYQML